MQLPVQTPARITNGAAAGGQAATAARRALLWRSMLRPCTPGLIGLAITVFLWGLGYKLSLYQPHREVSRKATMAKLWTGRRDLSAVSQEPRTQPHAGPRIHFLAAQGYAPPLATSAAACILRAPALVRLASAIRLPSRAPPSRLFA